mmetsp:Transcript_12882/g.24189  ORF Transcript_12882/g.24189 Transcript_12882/m.24189 type:complete len:251 (+) Transcript_12882:62-814(+)|eukprot:CAMPEP_0176498806 /NCGR_PEP_ID=MMETSP0200_2-20121128/12550_1 /TAXON_ID=947934 /ORGANISM="Chaetoceros sp., Strain GSL56" /LENGTH=250 /DNA_ID=CAMNT_0017897103 /DNA_START=51 /DNA_END=803 /DNA_ORIENTATION=-
MPPFNTDLSSSSCDGSINTMSSVNNYLQHDDKLTTNISIMKKIKKLNAEVRKFKAVADFTKAEAEETISEEMEEISKKIDEQRMALTAAKISKNQIKVKIESKIDFMRLNEKCIVDKENELKKKEEERFQLENEMNHLLQERERLASKLTELESMVSSVNRAMEDLLVDQEKIIASTTRMERELEKQSSINIEILRQFLESEIQHKNESNEILLIDNYHHHGSGSRSSKMNLVDVMKQQKEQLRSALSSS